MHQPFARAYQVYQKTELTTLIQVEIIARLYEALESSIHRAQKALLEGKIAKKGENISRALSIITELDSALNRKEGGEIALNLEAIYHYLTVQITEANLKNDPVCLENALKVINPIREAWQELTKKGNTLPVPTANAGNHQATTGLNASC